MKYKDKEAEDIILSIEKESELKNLSGKEKEKVRKLPKKFRRGW